ncbi:MAG: DeoR/GlpR transcriptional regulator [Oscillospiraceae bacterium]|nr:DeoR/GlpR transcriptional regulator [Oscillospiraceae bacterium]
MKSIRRNEIKKLIEKNGVVSIKELSSMFPSVSLMTIHRDLDALETDGVIVRVRGGAKYAGSSNHEASYDLRAVKNRIAKETIARKAAVFINGGSAVFLDSGTTMMELATAMPDVNAVVFTSGPNIALEASKKQNPSINLCGGSLNRSNMTLTGPSAVDMLSKINIDVAFLVASGYSLEGGFTCGRESDAQVKIEVVKKARTLILLMDSSKLGKLLPYTFANMSDIDYMISEAPLPDDVKKEAEKYGVKLL